MKPEILVSGAGVAGLVTAVILAERGGAVCLHEAGARIGSGASWMAGGML
ncbi:FAD-dependent oxidoreductase, partial [Acidomonas methanolica]